MSETSKSYFAMEAGEFLVELERLLSQPGQPDAGQLVRLAIAVRGSARMAEAETIARIAGRLEDAADALLHGDLAWSEDLRELALQTVGDLNILVRATQRWGPAEEQRVREAIRRWDAAGEGGSDAAVPITALFLDDPEVEGREEVVPIDALLAAPDDALRSAMRLSGQIKSRLNETPGVDPELRTLLDELIHLIELAAPVAARG